MSFSPSRPQTAPEGVVERWNQTIVGMVHCMVKAKKMPAAFSGEAVNMTVFILNRLLTKSLMGVAPFEAWHGRKPNVLFVHTFGCIGHVPDGTLGYEEGSKAYRLFDPHGRRVNISHEVFDENASKSWRRGSRICIPRPLYKLCYKQPL